MSPSRNFKKSGPAIDPDTCPPDEGAAGQQRVVRTPAGAAPITKPAGAAASVFDLGGKPSTRRGGAQVLLPALDITTLQVQKGVPVAPRVLASAGSSKWAPVFALLTVPDTSVALPLAYQGAVYAYMRKAKSAGTLKGTFIVRKCALNQTQCRIWRAA